MSDSLIRGFRAQLTITVDMVLRRAVFEVMNIFESTVHDYRMAFVQKEEEIAQLKIKLQTAELRLKDCLSGDKEGQQKSETGTQTRKNPKVGKEALGKPLSNRDVNEPEDWCAPLADETLTETDDAANPTVRLRQLSIPLQPIPVLKCKVRKCKNDRKPKTTGGRKSKRNFERTPGRIAVIKLAANGDHNKQSESSIHLDHGISPASSLKKIQKPYPNKEMQVPCPRPPRHLLRFEMQRLLYGIKQESSDPTCPKGLRRSNRNLTGEVKKQAKESRKSAQAMPISTKQNLSHTCKTCSKVFNTESGLRTHTRSHKWCRGCRKDFPSQTALRCHKTSCIKLKKRLGKNPTNPPKPSCDGTKTVCPSNKKLIIMLERTPCTESHSHFSTQGDTSTKKHSCPHCNETFKYRSWLVRHMRLHRDGKHFSCTLCPNKVISNTKMKKHMLQVHKFNLSDTKEDLAWNTPLEGIDDYIGDLISPSKNLSQTIKQEKKEESCSNVK